MYMEELKDSPKEEKILRRAILGYERSLGKEHEDTKGYARNPAILLLQHSQKT